MLSSATSEEIEDPLDLYWAECGEARSSKALSAWGWLNVAMFLVVSAAVMSAIVWGDYRDPEDVQRSGAPHGVPSVPSLPVSSIVASESAPLRPAAAPTEADIIGLLVARQPPQIWHANLAGINAPRFGIEGELGGLDPILFFKLERLGKQMRLSLNVISGLRSRSEQAELYSAYLSGTGNVAAAPGSSNHETGAAADVYVGGTALANVEGARAAAAQLGLTFPVPGEAWHVELASGG